MYGTWIEMRAMPNLYIRDGQPAGSRLESFTRSLLRNQFVMASLYKTILSSTLVASASAVNLYAAQSDGNVTSLSLTGSGSSYELGVTSVSHECEVNPSVLTLDKENSILYCYDRGGSVGTLNSFSTSADGTLSRIARVEGPASGVWAEILTAKSGKRAYITAS